ncbi:3-hydroxyacyl-CoA dehydrogenase NAD-binding domain-containing protein [Actinomycetospora lutea]|uniref:3-hydroxyacyl-CoA dehydrogenase NAD-binding domain-containing protein n=1 Tax=Actinomycetospora lutea TaxID=663604 RepID=UPI00236547A4|nr:3-hydroxyacyl-CoA dehydrogenase NAD-binding domain-containing protein [Actinomycetospora lutea]MDD7942462.1 3-hydroxyacyl-CoA dehydrogenase NAD-binding domain-containing protein [Actinomycetospora lutea]
MTRVAVVGTGVIGESWARLFLAHGHDVVATDPAPGAAERLPDAVTFVEDPAQAAADADFVQENGPERLEVKHALLAVLDAAARPDVVIASSSSALRPTDLARGAPEHPERVLVGHPFNPPHLVPLVEVVPGEATSEAAVGAAMAFYAGVGRTPLRLRAELPGHLANRLQAALWREAYSLVERGVATVADIDTAITDGPGLRWAGVGPITGQHLSGGAGGLAHVLEHLHPGTEALWADLGAPTMTPELAQRLVTQVTEAVGDAGPDALLARRDAVIRAALTARSTEDR